MAPLVFAEYKLQIIAKVLSNRLQKTLSDVINPDQIGCIKNRFCGENTRLIADIIDYCKMYKYSCIILFIDFKKGI